MPLVKYKTSPRCTIVKFSTDPISDKWKTSQEAKNKGWEVVMNSEAAIEPPGSRKMSTTSSENSNFHLNVTTEFTIITSLGK